MLTLRVDHAATLLASGSVLVTGGDNSVDPYYLSPAEIYDPALGKFAAPGSMASKRAYHTSTLLRSGKVLIAAGQALGFAENAAELWDPATGTFGATTALTISRYQHTGRARRDRKRRLQARLGRLCGELLSDNYFSPS
jgi:hypothetical protein